MSPAQTPVLPHSVAFRGSLVDAPVYGQLRFRADRIMVIDCHGRIAKIADGDNEAEVLAQFEIDASSVKRLKTGQFLVPGFVDTHVHAPQYKFTGTGTDMPLMEWLKQYTFPAEESCKDVNVAQYRYDLLIKRFLFNGTTTAMYHGSLHLAPNKVLVDRILALGQRAVVGKVNMDCHSPDNYIEETEDGLREAEEFVQYTIAKGCSRIQPCITPRFIPTCTPTLMKGLAALALKYNVHIQSHISECCGQVSFVKEQHPNYASDAAVFEDMGLLTAKTVMAHGTLLSDSDFRLLASRGTAVSHCPLSNFFLGDACFRVNHALSLGVKVGLGTDVAGGISPSMLTAQRMAVVNSRCLRAHKIANSGGIIVTAAMEVDVITYKEALWLATTGGAQALGLQDVIGSFDEGKELDALLLDTEVAGGPFNIFEGESDNEKLEKFLNLGDDRNIAEVYIQGVCVRRGDVFLSGQTGLTPAASLVKETGGIPVSASSVVQTPLPTSHVAEKDSKRIRLD